MKPFKRFLAKTPLSLFLFGPRGTGKTQWAHMQDAHSLWIDLLDEDQAPLFAGNPQHLAELVKQQKKLKTVVIDEIQKVPALLNVIHLLIETHKGIQFILTASSARKLRRQGVNLLGGRAALCKMHPYMAAELGSTFDLEKGLRLGMLPLVWGSADPEAQLKSYIGLYIQQEVKTEGITRSVESFSRFVEAISFSHGSIVNITNIARDCHVPRTTVQTYIEILEDLLLGFQINVFTKRAQRDLTAHPKFYFFDCGVYQYIRPRGFMDRPEEIVGATLEGLVAQHLRAWCDYSKEEFKLYFWRTRTGLEVDFVLYGETGLYAVEVKNAKVVKPKDLNALKEFKADYPMAKVALLHRGSDAFIKDEIPCLPAEAFLLALKPDKHPL